MAKKNTIADAYVNLIPSADGFSQKVSKAIDEGTSEGAKSASGGFSNLMTGFAMGIGQAAFGVVEDLGKKAFEVAKSSISAFAEYEQLEGGVQTLFGKQMKMADYIQNASVSAAQAVKDYRFIGTGEAQLMQDAAEAYKTAGLSANEYMELSIQSAASMISSLHGNTEKAANLVNMSIVDMADNVNKMGTSMESVQNAYRGFAKGNFTMLDNLALGYGGTKEEMERLLEDATKLSGVKYDMDSYADIVQAIHRIQEEMGVAGTTADEASTTIQGSLGMMKASWENLIAGIANEDADLGNLFDQLLQTVFGKEPEKEGEKRTNGFLDNILPRIEQVVSGFGEFIQLASAKLPDVFEKYLPGIVNTFTNIIQDIITNLTENSDTIIESIGSMFKTILENAFKLLKSLLSALPVILEVALQLIVTLANGLADFIPELVPTLIDVVVAICDVILDNLGLVVDAALAIIMALVDTWENMDEIVAAVIKIMAKIVSTFIQLLPDIASAAVQIAMTLISTLASEIMNMLTLDFFTESITAIIDAFIDVDWEGIGTRCIDGIVEGFKKSLNKVVDSAKKVGESIKTAFEKVMEIKSPSKVFKEYGEMLDKGLAIGIDSGDSIDATEQLARSINGEFTSTIGDFNASSNTDDAQILNLLSEQNSLLWQILNKNYGRSDNELFKSVQKSAKEYTRQTGSYAFGR